MNKKVIPVLLILAIAVGIIAYKPSLAWLDNSQFAKSQQVNIGQLKYSFDGEIDAAYIDESSTEYVLPGANLIYVNGVPGSLVAYNLSTITTNLRVRIDYTYYDTGTHTLIQAAYGDQTGDLSVAFAVPANWAYDSATKCWNYKPAGAPSGSPYEIPAYIEPVTASGETTIAPPAGDTIPLINSLGYSSALTAGNPYENQNIHITLTVEVKQADYVDWTTLISQVYP